MNSSFASNPLVSVIIPTRNRPILKDCLEHVFQQEYAPLEIIVIDSAPDQSARPITDGFPNVKYIQIKNARYGNHSQARNTGISQATGEFLAFIDDDCLVRPGWLTSLMKSFSKGDVGCVGGRVVDHYWPQDPRAPASAVGRIRPDNFEILGNFHVEAAGEIEVDHLPGGNMVCRSALARAIHGFDVNFRHGCGEETDFCLRIGALGCRLIYNPKSVVDHMAAAREGYTRSNRDRTFFFYSRRNWAYLCSKHFGLRRTIPFALLKQPYWRIKDSGMRVALRNMYANSMGIMLYLFRIVNQYRNSKN